MEESAADLGLCAEGFHGVPVCIIQLWMSRQLADKARLYESCGML